MKTIIHVNQHNIKHNRKNPDKRPVLSIKNYKETKYADSVKILDPCKIIYSADKPLSCGATVWIETNGRVHILDESNAN